jgi:epoxyqueuosine reductase
MGIAPPSRSVGWRMRPPTTSPPPAVLADQVASAVRASGAAAVGIGGAEPFEIERRALEGRKAAGLHDTMGFTYCDPVRATDPARALRGARAVVSAAWRTADDAGVPRPSSGDARIGRYAWEPYYDHLRRALTEGARILRAAGWRARVMVDDNGMVDRAAAVRAGIGWYGKNANVLLPGLGSWFVLGTMITTAPLPASVALEDGCGPCRRCLDGCPTGAIVAPGVVDARRCLAWVVQAPGPIPEDLRVAVGDRLYGCDDCQEVCPPNRRTPAVVASGAATPTVEALAVLRDTDDALLARAGRWFVADRDPRYLRRTALVVLGNTAEPGDGAARDALADVAQGDDLLLADHARWALRRLDARAAAGSAGPSTGSPMP